MPNKPADSSSGFLTLRCRSLSSKRGAKEPSMRISAAQRQSIVQATQKSFGEDARVWLFGSRADDSRRGGDVDLYVETNQRHPLMAELLCKLSIEERLDLHVDLVVNDHNGNKPIFIIAQSTGIQL
jgi:predicted nucleotidyltransferase